MRAQHVAQRRLRQQAGGVVGVLHIRHRHGGIVNAVVDDGVDRHGHRVLGEHLLRRHVERQRAQVHLRVVLDAGQDEENARPLGAAMQKATLGMVMMMIIIVVVVITQPPYQTKDDSSLVLLHHLDTKEQRNRKGARRQADRHHGEDHTAHALVVLRLLARCVGIVRIVRILASTSTSTSSSKVPSTNPRQS